MLETLDPPWCLLRDRGITFTSPSNRLAHSCTTPRWCRARRSPFEPGFLASIGTQTPDLPSKWAVIGARPDEGPVAVGAFGMHSPVQLRGLVAAIRRRARATLLIGSGGASRLSRLCAFGQIRAKGLHRSRHGGRFSSAQIAQVVPLKGTLGVMKPTVREHEVVLAAAPDQHATVD